MKSKNRLLTTINQNLKLRKKLFCAFLTIGYPSFSATRKLIVEFEKEGVDIIELGFPFSDPMADGPTIQYSSEQALKHPISIDQVFKMVGQLRREGSSVPILFFTYLNPIYHYGLKKFVQNATRAGMDGLIVPDLPPEEEPALSKACHQFGLQQVYLVAPTTSKIRAQKISKKSQGFVYYVSLRGVTGARKRLPSKIQAEMSQVRRGIHKPFLIGFGVASAKQARDLSRISQGVIVGSAIVDHLRKANGKTEPAVKFVRQLVSATKQV